MYIFNVNDFKWTLVMQKHCGMKVRTKPVCCLVRIGKQNPMHKPDLQNN